MPSTAAHLTVDVREIAPRDRHGRVLSGIRALRAGQSLELVNDHDPKPLYYQMQAEMPGLFGWDYVQDGPDVWCVRITRLAAAGSATQCCGHCA